MKKIVIVDGGPRKNMNTAQLLRRVAEGAKSVGEDIEVKTIRLYEIDFKGCMSCMACKLKDKTSKICRFKDALSPLLDEIAEADGLVLGSPIYFGEVTGKMRAFLERLAFPWLSYNDYSLTAPKRMPVVLVETMNGTPERNNSNHFGTMEWCLTAALGIVLITLIGVIAFKHVLDLPAYIGIVLIMAGVIIINLFSKMEVHSIHFKL